MGCTDPTASLRRCQAVDEPRRLAPVDSVAGLARDVLAVSSGLSRRRRAAAAAHRRNEGAQSWSPDGKVILFNAAGGQSRVDLWKIDAIAGATPTVFAGGEADQCCGKFSPDGAWIAYVSNESGRSEVFVRPFTGEAEPIQVSKDGGTAPAWHTGARELYFLSPENRLMSVSVSMTVRGPAISSHTTSTFYTQRVVNLRSLQADAVVPHVVLPCSPVRSLNAAWSRREARWPQPDDLLHLPGSHRSR